MNFLTKKKKKIIEEKKKKRNFSLEIWFLSLFFSQFFFFGSFFLLLLISLRHTCWRSFSLTKKSQFFLFHSLFPKNSSSSELSPNSFPTNFTHTHNDLCVCVLMWWVGLRLSEVVRAAWPGDCA